MPWSCRHEPRLEAASLPEAFTDRFGEGEGELVTLSYPKPLPMRLDRWLVSQRTEQSRADPEVH